MSERKILEVALTENPYEKGLAKGLADYYQEHDGATPFQALRRACLIRRLMLKTVELSEAETLLNFDKSNRDIAVQMMAVRCQVWQPGLVFLKVVAGSRPPSFVFAPAVDPDWDSRLLLCTVGARYVIRLFNEIGALVKPKK